MPLRTALVVEDNPACAELVEVALWSVPDLCIKVVSSVADARRALAADDPYSILITDVHLPGEDGLSLVQSIRTTLNSTLLPIIVITSSSDAALRSRARSLGVVEFFQKPFSPIKLREAVNSILNGT